MLYLDVNMDVLLTNNANKIQMSEFRRISGPSLGRDRPHHVPLRGSVGFVPSQLTPAEPGDPIWGDHLHDHLCLSGAGKRRQSRHHNQGFGHDGLWQRWQIGAQD